MHRGRASKVANLRDGCREAVPWSWCRVSGPVGLGLRSLRCKGIRGAQLSTGWEKGPKG